MNEYLKGWRGIITLVLSNAVIFFNDLATLVAKLNEVLGTALGEGGVAAGIISVLVGGKLAVTDVRKRIKGNLDK